MTAKPIRHVVRQGETLLSIALAHGMEPAAVWKAPENAKLTAHRDPDILAPGDILTLPPPPAPKLRVSPNSSNSYRGQIPRVEVRLCFHTDLGPMANEPYEIKGVTAPAEGPIEGKLDGAGGFLLELPINIEQFVLSFPKRMVEHTVWVGHLDPKDEPAGLRQRLLHLAYLPVQPQGQDSFVFASDEAFKQTLMWFQRGNGLEPSGNPDDATIDQLVDMAGA